MTPDAEIFAQKWIDSWNAHDLNAILAHYDDGFSITSPMIEVALGVATSTLTGKEAVGAYWKTALEKVPDLRFELIDVTQSIDSIAIYYRSVLKKRAIEVFFFNDRGKVEKAVAHYTG